MKKPNRAELRATAALLLALLLPLSMMLSPAAVLPKRAVDYTEDFTDAGYTDGVLIDNTALPFHEFWVVDQFANYNAAPCSYFEREIMRRKLTLEYFY